MALWEYKVITSGKGGFASATMLESFLNQLGRDEWEIVEFRTDPANPLAFNGLARRSTLREWTLEAAVAAAAKAEADKLRAELMQKQHAGDASASADAPQAADPASLRQLRDTDRDHDPEALADEASHGAEDWNNLDAYEDDLPVFFDAIKPHLRKNPNAPGQSVALNYLAKRWEQPEDDLNAALVECGFVIPESEADAPVYLEYEADLYWVEKNNRGQFFLNAREKPRPKFRIAVGKPLDPADPAYLALAEEQAAAEAERARRAAEQAAREAEAQARRAEREAQRQAADQARREQQAAAQAAREAAREAARAAAAEAAAQAGTPLPAESAAPAPAAATPPAEPGPLPEGTALLDAIRPQMRRNRRGPGYSGSTTYLARHFKVEEPVLRAALAALGLVAPAAGAKGETVAFGAFAYWVNLDGGGNLWINGRENHHRDRPEATASGTEPAPAESSSAEPAPTTTEAPAATDTAPAPEPGVFRPVPRAMPPVVAEFSTSAPAEAPPAPAAEPAPSSDPVPPAAEAPAPAPAPLPDALAALRPALQPQKGKAGAAAPLAALAESSGTTVDTLLATLAAQGLTPAPEGDANAKPTFVDFDGETYWLGRSPQDGALWLNAKPTRPTPRRTPKAADGSPAPRPRTKRRSASAIEADAAAEE